MLCIRDKLYICMDYKEISTNIEGLKSYRVDMTKVEMSAINQRDNQKNTRNVLNESIHAQITHGSNEEITMGIRKYFN